MPSFFLSLALAATFVVPEDGSLHDALDDPQFSLIQIQDGQTLADETPFTIDRDLTIEGLGEVELPDRKSVV